MLRYDVVVIGGGVVGGLILRELTKYNLSVALLEAGSDVCSGQSRANSGIVHAGFDAVSGTNKAKFNVEGAKMMPQITKELGVKFKNNGALVVAFNGEDLEILNELKVRGETNGVSDLSIIGKEELNELEPNISSDAIGALYAKTSGIVCPYGLTIASIGNAMDNGAKLHLDFKVVKADKVDGGFIVYSEDGQSVFSKVVINSAGYGSQKVAEIFGDIIPNVGYRKGEYIILDRESGDFVSKTLFFTPTAKGKGILVSPTVDGNIILGPTAEVIDEYSTKTTQDGLKSVIEKAGSMCKKVPLYNTITSFTGVRAFSDKHDFIIENSQNVNGLINLSGIESPGLTSSPAIAKYVVEELVSKHFTLVKNDGFNGNRKAEYFFKDLSIEEKNEIIKKNPDYGKIVCRCEQITEGEIRSALRQNPKANSVDGIKLRTRSGMGRCQGGFCQPRIVEIIAEELNVSIEQVKKKNKGSEIIIGKTKW